MAVQAIEQCFKAISSQNAGDASNTTFLLVRFCEFKQDAIRDLLARQQHVGSLKLKVDAQYGAYVEGVHKWRLDSLQDCEDVLAEILSLQPSMDGTAHTVFTLDVVAVPKAMDKAAGPVRISKLHLVSLAAAPAESNAMSQVEHPHPRASNRRHSPLHAPGREGDGLGGGPADAPCPS